MAATTALDASPSVDVSVVHLCFTAILAAKAD